jgi:hypothetical protein
LKPEDIAPVRAFRRNVIRRDNVEIDSYTHREYDTNMVALIGPREIILSEYLVSK